MNLTDAYEIIVRVPSSVSWNSTAAMPIELASVCRQNWFGRTQLSCRGQYLLNFRFLSFFLRISKSVIGDIYFSEFAAPTNCRISLIVRGVGYSCIFFRCWLCGTFSSAVIVCGWWLSCNFFVHTPSRAFRSVPGLSRGIASVKVYKVYEVMHTHHPFLKRPMDLKAIRWRHFSATGSRSCHLGW